MQQNINQLFFIIIISCLPNKNEKHTFNQKMIFLYKSKMKYTNCNVKLLNSFQLQLLILKMKTKHATRKKITSSLICIKSNRQTKKELEYATERPVFVHLKRKTSLESTDTKSQGLIFKLAGWSQLFKWKVLQTNKKLEYATQLRLHFAFLEMETSHESTEMKCQDLVHRQAGWSKLL